MEIKEYEKMLRYIDLFERNLQEVRARNGWIIELEFGGIWHIRILDKETREPIAATGMTSLGPLLEILDMDLKKPPWRFIKMTDMSDQDRVNDWNTQYKLGQAVEVFICLKDCKDHIGIRPVKSYTKSQAYISVDQEARIYIDGFRDEVLLSVVKVNKE